MERPCPFDPRRICTSHRKRSKTWQHSYRKPRAMVQTHLTVDHFSSVSYTHLDVYKRQDYECARSVEELFQKCNGVKYMTKLDITSGFWRIPIRKCDRQYTAFLYRNRCYQFKVVPFVLSTSLAAMVRCLDSALGNEVENYTLVFVDDILCVSQTFEEHLQH